MSSLPHGKKSKSETAAKTNWYIFYVDDHTCRIWDVESGQERALLYLTSPGISVKWIPNEPNKVAQCRVIFNLFCNAFSLATFHLKTKLIL